MEDQVEDKISRIYRGSNDTLTLEEMQWIRDMISDAAGGIVGSWSTDQQITKTIDFLRGKDGHEGPLFR